MVTIYLIHFSTRYKHAGHYLGSAEDLEARLAEHRAGQGARLLAVVAAAGIDWQVARTWEGATRQDESTLKRAKMTPRLCPVCNPRAERCGKLDKREKAQ
jgi:predicted GIY-YIG superfamily endonuclease